jgi:uncharacterized membrane protein (DUF373 family)
MVTVTRYRERPAGYLDVGQGSAGGASRPGPGGRDAGAAFAAHRTTQATSESPLHTLSKRLLAEPRGLLQISDILATFGAFMAVLIAIEIFVNIISYLREDVIHVRIVLATAMMAIARKVIILDYNTTSPQYIYATAAVVAAMALAYWLVVRERLTKAEEG